MLYFQVGKGLVAARGASTAHALALSLLFTRERGWLGFFWHIGEAACAWLGNSSWWWFGKEL